MKEILIAAKNLKIGGIEKSLVNLVNYLKRVVGWCKTIIMLGEFILQNKSLIALR